MCAIILGVLALPIEFGAQESEASKIARLLEQLGGLTDSFSEEEFLGRPALKELLILDREAIPHLERALATSANWSIRASAAYLLGHLGASATLYPRFYEETHPIVKAILYYGATLDVAGKGKLQRELATQETLSEERREELLRIGATALSLGDSEIAAKFGILLRPLESTVEPNEIVRASRVLKSIGAAGLPALLPHYDSLTSENGRLQLLAYIGTSLGSADLSKESDAALLKGYTQQFLTLLVKTSADLSPIVRGRSVNLALNYALYLHDLGQEADQFIQLIRRLADGDPAYSDVATAALEQWKDYLRRKEAKSRSEPSLSDPKLKKSRTNQPSRTSPIPRDKGKFSENEGEGLEIGVNDRGRVFVYLGVAVVAIGALTYWAIRKTRSVSR